MSVEGFGRQYLAMGTADNQCPSSKFSAGRGDPRTISGQRFVGNVRLRTMSKFKISVGRGGGDYGQCPQTMSSRGYGG